MNQRVEIFLKELNKFNKINIDYKSKSKLMKMLNIILFFNRGFMTKFATTIGNTIYLTNDNFLDREFDALVLIAHEYEHIIRSNKLTHILYSLLYLSPQIFSLFGIVAAFFIGWWALLFLLFLAPIPSPGRSYIEYLGYKMSIFTAYNLYIERGYSKEDAFLKIVDYIIYLDKTHFKGSSYYFMAWPFGVNKQLKKALENTISGDIFKESSVYNHVKNALQKSSGINEKENI